MSTLKGKKVLITGGASGIGKIMGRLVLEHGAELVIWDINPGMAEETRAELSKYGKVSFFKVDVSSKEEISTAAATVREKIGVVDVLINNAGIVVGKYFHEHSAQDIERTMDINASAPMLVTREFLPGMIRQDFGHICNIASSAGLISNPRMSVYAASKWSVIGWSDSVRLEMKMLKKKVNVTTVTPYYINTGMFDGVRSIIPILKPERVASKVIRGIEHNRIFVSMPWSVHFVRFFQGLLPVSMFDWFVGSVMGIYKTMDHFQGRK
jgi:short-subunit dehydrogenase